MGSRQLSHSLKDFIFDLEKKMNENPRKVILKVQFLGKRDQKIFSKLTIHSIIPRKKVYHYCNRSTYREVYAFR